MNSINSLSLDNVQELCWDKHILLIGNARERKENITHDICVRMNYGVLGGDADIWVNNIAQSFEIQRQLARIKSKCVLRLNAERDGYRLNYNYPEELHHKTYFWNAFEYKQMIREIGFKRPLTGTIAIYWFLRYTKPDLVTITGFNFFQTENAFTGTTATPCHSVDKDRDYVNQLIEDGLVIWN